MDEIQGLRNPKKRSILEVCEHFEDKHNAEFRHFHQPEREVVKMDEIQGLRNPKKRSILEVCEHFEDEHNAEFRHFHNFSQ